MRQRPQTAKVTNRVQKKTLVSVEPVNSRNIEVLDSDITNIVIEQETQQSSTQPEMPYSVPVPALLNNGIGKILSQNVWNVNDRYQSSPP